ncbi:MAG: hypothetical protein RL013_2102, partial [Bacteroidota bacterium]
MYLRCAVNDTLATFVLKIPDRLVLT